MGRYKGKQEPKSIERDFPHVVEIAVPPNGLGNVLIAMYDFHTRFGIEARRGHGRREYGGNFIRWRFADPVLAAGFASEFGATPPDFLSDRHHRPKLVNFQFVRSVQSRVRLGCRGAATSRPASFRHAGKGTARRC